MNLLLDTHIWLWALLEPDRLVPAVREALASDDNVLWISPISVWEALLLAERGRVRVTTSPLEWIEEMVRAIPSREAPLTHDIAAASRRLSLAHNDPADRFLAATAYVNGMTLVTADSRLLASTEYAVLANV